MCPVKMERAASDDLSLVLEYDKITDVFADLRQRARQKRSVVGVAPDQIVNILCIRKNCLTRVHVSPREATRFSFWLPRLPAALAPERCLPERHGPQARRRA